MRAGVRGGAQVDKRHRAKRLRLVGRFEAGMQIYRALELMRVRVKGLCGRERGTGGVTGGGGQWAAPLRYLHSEDARLDKDEPAAQEGVLMIGASS